MAVPVQKSNTRPVAVAGKRLSSASTVLIKDDPRSST